jgi:hypothetical protein
MYHFVFVILILTLALVGSVTGSMADNGMALFENDADSIS